MQRFRLGENGATLLRIGLLADTHLPSSRQTLWSEVKDAFADVNLILHAGDILSPRVLDWLEEIAPVLAAQGNNDPVLDARIRPQHWVEIGKWRLMMVHDMEPESRPIDELQRIYCDGDRVDIMVSGHTHVERIDYRDGVLQLNPGSPTHPHNYSTRLGTVALLELSAIRIEARILRLGVTPGMANPGCEFAFTTDDRIVRRVT